jgi:hypothetical protein
LGHLLEGGPGTEGAGEMVRQLALRIHLRTGLDRADILEAIRRLPRGEGLDGTASPAPIDPGAYWVPSPAERLAAEYAGLAPRRNLSHVLAPLRELDNDRTTDRLWRWLWCRWPVFRDVFSTGLALAQGGRHQGDAAPPSATTQEQQTQPSRASGMSREEANQRAMDLAALDPGFVHKTQREWATAIGCSVGQVARTRLWEKTMEVSGRGRKGKPKRPKAVALTDKVLATQAQDAGAPTLDRLVAEQEGDAEPSPLEDDPPDRPRRVWAHREV